MQTKKMAKFTKSAMFQIYQVKDYTQELMQHTATHAQSRHLNYCVMTIIAGLDAEVSSITKCLCRWCSTKQCTVSENIHTYPITEGWGGGHNEIFYKEGG